MRRPEHTVIACLKIIITTFTKPDELVVKLCAGVFSIPREGMMLPIHRSFVVYDMESAILVASKEAFALIYATKF